MDWRIQWDVGGNCSFFFLELKTAQTLENTLKVVFDRLLAYGGSYKGYSCHSDEDGNMNLVFRHEYGMKWSRILSAVYTRFVQRTLNQPAYPLKLAQTWFAIRLTERIENRWESDGCKVLQNAAIIIIMRSRVALISLRNDNHQLLSLILRTRSHDAWIEDAKGRINISVL